MADIDREVSWLRRMSQSSPRPYSDASDELIASMGDDAFNAAVQAEAHGYIDHYQPEHYYWQPDQPEDICGCCYHWGRYPPGQRQFGYVGKRVCPDNCACAHHETEIWIADTVPGTPRPRT
jgi:hypothetical protein